MLIGLTRRSSGWIHGELPVGRSRLVKERECPCKWRKLSSLRRGNVAEAVRHVLLVVLDGHRVVATLVDRIREDEVEDHRDRPERENEEQHHEEGDAEDTGRVVGIDLVAAWSAAGGPLAPWSSRRGDPAAMGERPPTVSAGGRPCSGLVVLMVSLRQQEDLAGRD